MKLSIIDSKCDRAVGKMASSAYWKACRLVHSVLGKYLSWEIVKVRNLLDRQEMCIKNLIRTQIVCVGK